jgi:hypothetical protein
MTSLSRRTILTAALAAPLLGLPGCATIGNHAYEDAVRRLLAISSERAFARLLREDGFSGDDLTRITLPAALGRTESAERLLRQVDYAARVAAERAPTVVRDAIANMTIIDAAAVFDGGPTAATDLLRGEMGETLFTALMAGVGEALRMGDSAAVDQALAAETSINLEGLRLEVARQTSEAIYKAIGREEAAIRADPSSVGDLILRSSLR